MKKTIYLLALALVFILSLFACGKTPKKDDPLTTETNSSEILASAEHEATDKTAPDTDTPTDKYEGFNPEDYDFIQMFEAPEGDYREIVKNYMLSMADYKWIAGEDFSITWKNEGDFKVNLNFEKGKTYYGLPYSEKRASLEQFSMFVENGGTFTYDTYYYEELVGNHCSSSMGLAYQQIIDFPYAGSLKPVGARRGVIKLIDGLKQPDGDTTKDWYSEDVIKLNGKDKIFEAYAKMGTGDILGKFIKTSGHSRMVSRVETKVSATGKPLPGRSMVYCIEQTNAFDKSRTDRNTTWWIDHPYSFQELLDTNFIPLTLEIFHNGESLKNAVIAFKGKNTPESITKSINGTVTSNFPLSYVRATIEDSNGNIVGEIYEHKFDKAYAVSLRNFYHQLNIDKLPSGTYTYKLRAGIARGGCEIESFQFTIG